MIPPPPAPGDIDPFRALMRFVENQTGTGQKYAADVMKPIHAEFGAKGWPDYVHACRDKIPALMERLKAIP